MATINRSNIGPLHDKITIELEKSDYYPQFEKALKKYSSQVQMPGFRKGQVPVGMVKKMYGPSIFMDEVVKVAYDKLEVNLRESNDQIFANPLPMADNSNNFDFSNPTNYTFNFEIGLKPEFSIKHIEEKAPITEYKIKVTDEILQKEIENVQKRAGKLVDQNVQSADEDLIYLNIVINGKESAEPIEDVQEYGRSIPEIKAAFNGAATGHKVQFNTADIKDENDKKSFFSQSLKIKDENPQDLELSIELTKVAHLQPKELSEEFYKEVFPDMEIADEDAFKSEMSKAIASQLERYSKDKLNNDIFEMLIHETDIQLPVDFLKRWLEIGGEKQKSKDEVEAEWSQFEHQLKWTLISDELIKKYQISVTKDEIAQDIKNNIMMYFGAASEDDAPWMASYIERMMKDEKTMDETFRKILMAKLFVAIENDLSVQIEEVTDEEFSKLESKYHKH